MYRLFAVFFLVLAGCGGGPKPPASDHSGHDHSGHDHSGHDHSGEKGHAASQPTTLPADILPNDGTRKLGDVTRCPVSGDVFTIAADTPTFEHAGGTYFLCCGGCVKDLAADPDKFLKPAD